MKIEKKNMLGNYFRIYSNSNIINNLIIYIFKFEEKIFFN